MKRRLPTCITALALVLAVAGPARADTTAQNLRAQARLAEQVRGFACPANVDAEARRLVELPGQALPPHLQASTTSERQMRLPFLIEYFKSMPKAQQDMMLNSPGVLDAQAGQMNMSPAELRQALVSGQLPAAAAPRFLSLPAATLALRNEARPACDADCEANLRWNLITAVALWKTACVNCTDDFLAIVGIDGSHWVDERILTWLRSARRTTLDDFPFMGRAGSVAARVRPAAHGGTVGTQAATSAPLAPLAFTLVAPRSAEQALLCAPAAGPSPPRAMRHIRAALCGGPAAAADESARMQLQLKPGPTSCGPSDDFLGCGRVDNSVELTLEGVRYRFPNFTADQPFSVGPAGAPELSGFAVLIHEVGHWFGLPHLNFRADSIPDFMQDTYREDACATLLTFRLMATMSDAAHAQRYRMGGGLKRPAKARR